MFSGKKDSPKVFISYSYDSKEHEDWVVKLTNDLRAKAGIDAVIDKFALDKTSDLNSIMIEGFSKSDKVIIISTEKYAQKAESLKSGVGFEIKLATSLSRDEATANKLIFIKRDSNCKNFNDIFPLQFKDSYAIDFSDNGVYSVKFEELYYKIYDQPYTKIVGIGKSPFKIEDTVDITGENVYKTFDSSGFELYNLKLEDLSKKSTVIWPIVPRLSVNLIHRSQLEVVRMLSMLGWNIKIIIANCGKEGLTPNTKDIEFRENLLQLLRNRGVKEELINVNFLNKYYTASTKNKRKGKHTVDNFYDQDKILSNFVKISSSLDTKLLTSFNTKNATYGDDALKQIENRTTLKYMSPLFIWAAVVYEADKLKNRGCKPIIVAGRDEESQWNHVVSKINPHIGALLIPILKNEDDSTFFQDTQGNELILSKQVLNDKIGKGNFDKWLAQSFICLAKFPENIHRINNICPNKGTEECNSNESCFQCMFKEGDKLPDYVNKDEFISIVYPLIN